MTETKYKKSKYSKVYEYLSGKWFETSVAQYSFPRFTINLFKEIDWQIRKVQHISFVSVSKSVDDFEEFIKQNI